MWMRDVVVMALVAGCATTRPPVPVTPPSPEPAVGFFEPAVFARVPADNTGAAIVDCTPDLSDEGIVFRLPVRVVMTEGGELRLPICGQHALPMAAEGPLRATLRDIDSGVEYAGFVGPDPAALTAVYNYDLAPLINEAPRATTTYDVALFVGSATSSVHRVMIVWP